MALGMDWGNPIHRFGVVLSGLGLGTIPLERLSGNFRAFGLVKCSFSVQLDIQSTTANTIVAAQSNRQKFCNCSAILRVESNPENHTERYCQMA